MESFFSRLLSPTRLKRFLFFFAADFVLIAISLYFSFLLRFDFSLNGIQKRLFIEALPVFLLIKLSVFLGFRLCNVTWKYVGLRDLLNIAAALFVSESALVLLMLLPDPSLRSLQGGLFGWALRLPSYPAFLPLWGLELHGFPRSVFLIDWANSLILVMVIRLSKRVYLEVFCKSGHAKAGQKTLIIGAGNVGEMILRDMARNGFSPFYPVGLLDDDTSKVGAYVHGVKVLGRTSEMKEMVLKRSVEAVIIAIPSLNQKALRSIYNAAVEAGIKTVKIVPRIYDFNRPGLNFKGLESIKIEDLIGRQSVHVDGSGIRQFLKDKVVLVTGAGGSIGSEITRQVCSCTPDRIVLFDIDETELHNMELSLKKTFPRLFGQGPGMNGRVPAGASLATRPAVSFIVGDIRDRARLQEVFSLFRPQIVFHAAAYKHVPMMEYNPHEAVKVNIFGARNMAEVSCANGVQKFIMISTDKAVRPTSVMGASKRMAEHVCKAFNGRGKTEFVSVRFGNVLGSRGSVLPLFLEQLKEGGPLTVTHKDMKRYFMTIPEAVSLVMQASLIGRGGEVLALDMGAPVRIIELAEELIRLNGMEPYKDIDIVFEGLRPGEKLFEEILTAEEGAYATRHEKIFIAKNGDGYSHGEIGRILKEFYAALSDAPSVGSVAVKALLKKYVIHFQEDPRFAGTMSAKAPASFGEGRRPEHRGRREGIKEA